MRKLIVLVSVCLFLASSAYAATEDIADGMYNKAKRGVINLFTGIIEVPVQTYKGYDKGFDFIGNKPLSKGVGTILGFFRGVGHAAGRISWGALELFGFWTANHRDNWDSGIPFDAKYAWEWGEQYSIFNPSLEDGVKPIGKKLGRGVADAFLGIAEIPGQTIKGNDEGNMLLGFGRGLWYWVSSEVYGIGNIFTCIVPNPKDNPGYAFDEEWPWTALATKVK